MRTGFIYLFLMAAALTFQIGCTRATTDNSNLTNANSSPATKTAAVEEAPPSAFTDARSALAEGKKLLDENKTEKAVEAFRQAIKLDPELADAHFNLGIALALLEKEQTNNAINTTSGERTKNVSRKDKKGKKGKNDKDEVVNLTPSQKEFEQAAKLYEKITDKNPKDAAAFYSLGLCYNKLNQDEDAEDALREAVKLKPDDVDYKTALGEILIKLAHYDDAVDTLKDALKLDPSNVYLQELLDKAEAGQKRIEYAVKNKTDQQQQQASQTGKSQTNSAATNNLRQRPTPSLTMEEKPLPKPISNH